MKKLFIALLPVVLFSGPVGKIAAAQASAVSEPSAGFQGWNKNQPTSTDAAITALIQAVSTDHASGMAAGLHILLGTPQGALDASFGPYLAQDIQQALVPGAQVQVTGQVTTVNGHKYLLVRCFVLNNREITVRNDRGSLVHQQSQVRIHTQSQNDGGIR
jgi:hypothetical protein